MTSSRKRIIWWVTVAVVVTVTAFVIINRCSSSTEKEPSVELTPEQSAHKILSEPAVFDAQNLEQMAAEIMAEKEFTLEQFSQMIVAVEAVVNRLAQETDLLVANDDAADSWNVLREYAAAPWIGHSATIVDFLEKAPLTDEQASRLKVIHDMALRINACVADIERYQLGERSTALHLPY